LLDVASETRPLVGLRQPRVAGGVETVCRGIRLPGERNAASVAAVALAVGAEPRRVLTELVGDLHRFGQAELFALVEVRRTGQCEHDRGRCASTGEAGRLVGLAHRLRADSVALRAV